jgi:hypothetical protein
MALVAAYIKGGPVGPGAAHGRLAWLEHAAGGGQWDGGSSARLSVGGSGRVRLGCMRLGPAHP